MKLRRGKNEYKLPAYGQVLQVYILGRDYIVPLYHVRLSEIGDKSELGVPAIFVLTPRWIIFYPTPDRAYEVKVRYTPPVREL
jgi:hypothetical protein